MRWVFVAVMLIHGFIHSMGVVRAFHLAEVPGLTQPISRVAGGLWLAAALGIVAAALLPIRWLWIVGTIALLLSQAAIISAWSEARFGTLVNIVLLAGVLYSFAAYGPVSLRTEYRACVRTALAGPLTADLVSEEDIASLPEPIQRYLRLTGSVGKPKISNFRATWRGQIRGGAKEPWMAFTAEQHNGYGAGPSRLFFMDAVMMGLPVDVFHRFLGGEATFRVRVLSLVPMVTAKGPQMTRAETVTLLNDMVLLAPAALLDADVAWEPVDSNRVRVRYTRNAQTVSAELIFDDTGELIDFISDDRLRASADGTSFTAQRWSTPASDYRMFGERRVIGHGEAWWHEPDGAFPYLELDLVDIEYNVSP